MASNFSLVIETQLKIIFNTVENNDRLQKQTEIIKSIRRDIFP